MSDFNRNVTSAQYGTTAGQTVAVDAGLRAYMLHVYNYMVIGLAITGLAALGIYMMSMTGDAAAAAKIDPQRRRDSRRAWPGTCILPSSASRCS